jgi:CheY-like chemotaxis protein
MRMLSERVLLVDDEPRVGRSYARALRKVVRLEQAESGEEALALLRKTGPVAVIVADMRMARMDGIDLLKVIAERYPDTVRIMLTGNIDQRTASRAINEAGVYRYLTKPCDAMTFGEAVLAGIRKYQGRRVEREFLDCQPEGARQVAEELLQLLNPGALQRLPGLKRLARGVIKQSDAKEDSSADLIALFALVGTGVGDAPGAVAGGQHHDFTELAYRLALAVPGLGRVAEGVRYQLKNFDGSGIPQDEKTGEEIPFLGRLLRIIMPFDDACRGGSDEATAFASLVDERQYYDHTLLCALARHLGLAEPEAAETLMLEGVPVTVDELTVGMVLSEPVTNAAGAVLMARGKVLTASGIARLRSFSERAQLGRDIRIFEVDDEEDEELLDEGGVAESA